MGPRAGREMVSQAQIERGSLKDARYAIVLPNLVNGTACIAAQLDANIATWRRYLSCRAGVFPNWAMREGVRLGMKC
jgi:hypothetical protein